MSSPRSILNQMPRKKLPAKPLTAISPAQVFKHDGVSYHIIKNKGHVLMRDQFLRGQKSWNRVFNILIAGGSSLYGTLRKLEEYK